MGKRGEIKLILPKNNASKNDVDAVLQITYENDGFVTSNLLHRALSHTYFKDKSLDETSISHRSVTPRYFGLLIQVNKNSYQLTEFGEKYITSPTQNKKIDSLFEALSSTTFGIHNDGVSSESAVEPPILLLRAINDRSKLTTTEFAFLLFYLEVENLSYTKALEKLASLQDYTLEKQRIVSLGGNKFFDPKIHLFLAENHIIEKQGRNHFILSEYTRNNYSNFINSLNVFNKEFKDDSAKNINRLNLEDKNKQDISQSLNAILKLETYSSPKVQMHVIEDKSKKTNTLKTKHKSGVNLTSNKLSHEQANTLGWLGEKYIYQQMNSNDSFLESLGLKKEEIFEIVWFNSGFENDSSWQDKSIGHGYDLEIVLNNKKKLVFEIKTSFHKVTFFSVTTNELLTMNTEKNNYYLIKINNFSSLENYESPSVTIINNPIRLIDSLSNVKELTLYY